MTEPMNPPTVNQDAPLPASDGQPSACPLHTSLLGGQAETRDEYLQLFAGTTPADVAFAIKAAQCPCELDAAGHLSLVLFGVAATRKPFTERGRVWPSLVSLLSWARGRLGGLDPTAYRLKDLENQAREEATARRRSASRAARDEREERIRQLGYLNATSR